MKEREIFGGGETMTGRSPFPQLIGPESSPELRFNRRYFLDGENLGGKWIAIIPEFMEPVEGDAWEGIASVVVFKTETIIESAHGGVPIWKRRYFPDGTFTVEFEVKYGRLRVEVGQPSSSW